MVERTFSNAGKTPKKPRHVQHGLSRETGGGVVLPVVLGLICAVAVLVVLWVAYTYG